MAKKIIRLSESDLKRIVERVISEESYWERLFGKASTKDAADSALRSKGYSHTGREDDNRYFIEFDGKRYYEDKGEIEYASVYDTGKIPRDENGVLLIKNPAWSL